MNQVTELMFKPRRVNFARSLERMNPELIEIEDMRRQALGPDPDIQPAPHKHRKLAAAAVAVCVAGGILIGRGWGLA